MDPKVRLREHIRADEHRAGVGEQVHVNLRQVDGAWRGAVEAVLEVSAVISHEVGEARWVRFEGADMAVSEGLENLPRKI